MQYRTSNYASQVFDAYFFEKNVQGDIIGVYNSTGKKIGAYTYDAWGKCSLSGANGNTILEDKVVAFYNPFRYRGYYYDYETGFYYLQSRYYNPEWGRFLNADGYISTGTGLLGHNMFAYCNNSPVMNVDPTGDFPLLILSVILISALPLMLSSCSADNTSSPPSNYVEEKSRSQNCYSYAFGLPISANPGDFSVSKQDSSVLSDKSINTPDEITSFVMRDMQQLGMDVRVVSNPSDKGEDEYIVAMKTSTMLVPGYSFADYHFARQLSDGTWADKPGQTPSRWNKIDGMAATWDLGNQKGYYNTKTVYFAVKRG